MISYKTIPQKNSHSQRFSQEPKTEPKTLYDLNPTPAELESILGDSEETLDFYLGYASKDEKLSDIALIYKLRGDVESFEAYWQKITNPLVKRSLKEFSLREFTEA